MIVRDSQGTGAYVTIDDTNSAEGQKNYVRRMVESIWREDTLRSGLFLKEISVYTVFV